MSPQLQKAIEDITDLGEKANRIHDVGFETIRFVTAPDQPDDMMVVDGFAAKAATLTGEQKAAAMAVIESIITELPLLVTLLTGQRFPN